MSKLKKFLFIFSLIFVFNSCVADPDEDVNTTNPEVVVPVEVDPAPTEPAVEDPPKEEPTQGETEEQKDEPVVQPGDPTKETGEDQPTEPAVEEPVEEPVKDPVEEPGKEPTEEPSKDPVEEPGVENPSSGETDPVEDPSGEDPSIKEPTEEQPEDPGIKEPTEEQPEDPGSDQPTEPVVEEPIEEPEVEEPGSGETGGEVTVIQTLKISEGTTDVANTKSKNPLTITFKSGETLVFEKNNSRTDPRYDTSYVRLYGGGKLTINGSGEPISNITITLKRGNNTTNNTFSADTGSVEARNPSDEKLVWNVSETKPKSVVLTQSGSSGHYQISEIVITYNGTSSSTNPETENQGNEQNNQPPIITVANVNFNPTGSTIRAGNTVSFSSATTNAEIYYSLTDTLNTSNYTNATKGNSYTILADTTEASIKFSAIAVLTVEDKNYFSNESSKTYTILKTEVSQGGQGSSADNSHMLLGNPDNATTDVSNKTNYLMDKTYYTISYNDTTRTPNWVSWHLDSSDLGSQNRLNNFRPDDELPSGFYKVSDGDYSGSGYSRGHMCPSGERTSSRDANSSTFLMTNMVPQNQTNNGGPWNGLETAERDFASSGKECYIICGPAGNKGKISSGVQIPESVWKIVLVLDKGDNDLERINANTTVIAVNMQNDDSCRGNWQNYLVTVDDLETLTGYDFFSALSPELQTTLQSKKYSGN